MCRSSHRCCRHTQRRHRTRVSNAKRSVGIVPDLSVSDPSVSDLIVVNARIATGDPRRPWVTALAVRDGLLVALGASAELMKRRTGETMVMDARGAELTLPAGAGIGTPLAVRVANDGAVRIFGEEEPS